ncbi:hypothetical protein J1614_001571 [Plenodomus biglobosus]|nr:hypothetical protein J1614_001571 [Plenodomus biglobosus]
MEGAHMLDHDNQVRLARAHMICLTAPMTSLEDLEKIQTLKLEMIQIEKLLEERTWLVEKIDELIDLVDKLNNKLKHGSKERAEGQQTKTIALHADLEAAQRGLQTATDSIRELKEQVSSGERYKKKLELSLSERYSQVKSLRKTVQAKEETTSALQSTIENRDNEIQDIKTDNDHHKKEIESLQADLGYANRNIEELAEESSKAQLVAKAREKIVEELQLTAAAHESELKSLSKERDTLAALAKARDANIEGLQHALKTLSKERDTLAALVRARDANIKGLRHEVDKQTATVTMHESELRTLNEERDTRAALARACDARLHEVLIEMDRQTAMVAMRESELRAVNTERDGQAVLIRARDVKLHEAWAEIDRQAAAIKTCDSELKTRDVKLHEAWAEIDRQAAMVESELKARDSQILNLKAENNRKTTLVETHHATVQNQRTIISKQDSDMANLRGAVATLEKQLKDLDMASRNEVKNIRAASTEKLALFVKASKLQKHNLDAIITTHVTKLDQMNATVAKCEQHSLDLERKSDKQAQDLNAIISTRDSQLKVMQDAAMKREEEMRDYKVKARQEIDGLNGMLVARDTQLSILNTTKAAEIREVQTALAASKMEANRIRDVAQARVLDHERKVQHLIGLVATRVKEKIALSARVEKAASRVRMLDLTVAESAQQLSQTTELATTLSKCYREFVTMVYVAVQDEPISVSTTAHLSDIQGPTAALPGDIVRAHNGNMAKIMASIEGHKYIHKVDTARVHRLTERLSSYGTRLEILQRLYTCSKIREEVMSVRNLLLHECLCQLSQKFSQCNADKAIITRFMEQV